MCWGGGAREALLTIHPHTVLTNHVPRPSQPKDDDSIHHTGFPSHASNEGTSQGTGDGGAGGDDVGWDDDDAECSGDDDGDGCYSSDPNAGSEHKSHKHSKHHSSSEKTDDDDDLPEPMVWNGDAPYPMVFHDHLGKGRDRLVCVSLPSLPHTSMDHAPHPMQTILMRTGSSVAWRLFEKFSRPTH